MAIFGIIVLFTMFFSAFMVMIADFFDDEKSLFAIIFGMLMLISLGVCIIVGFIFWFYLIFGRL